MIETRNNLQSASQTNLPTVQGVLCDCPPETQLQQVPQDNVCLLLSDKCKGGSKVTLL